jgi:hypothetical protein
MRPIRIAYPGIALLLSLVFACSTTGKAPTEASKPVENTTAGSVMQAPKQGEEPGADSKESKREAKARASVKEPKLGAKAAEAGEFPRVTLKQKEGTLGEAVRHIGQESGGGLVLAFGLESVALPALSFNQANYETVAQKLAGLSNSALQNCSTYYFLMKPGTESLRDVTLLGKLSPRYESMRVGFSFGAGTRVFTALALINEATGANVVADNAIADVRCGELALGELPIQYGLEAVLKSAQVVAFEVESTEEYIFLRYNQNDSLQDTLLNRHQIDDRQAKYLPTKVSVFLPEAPKRDNDRPIIAGAKPLRDVLETLSNQLGIQVVAERSMLDFPVNPLVLKDVRVQTAMNLIIRQWPVGEFGYQFAHDRFIIRRMTEEEKKGI